MLKLLFITFHALVQGSTMIASAQEKVEGKTIDQMMDTIKMEKIQAESIIYSLGNSRRLSREEVSRVKREIAEVEEKNLQDAKKEAVKKINPSKSVSSLDQ